ncbi:MAG: hypothetical protein NPIRA06_21060 [Nitrospirales bacterium]|nr:MAG: hypothetical protein NPIRA06_21060 [Nitrospirales bacterium]
MPPSDNQARETIDTLLSQAGWIIQDSNQFNLSAVPGGDIRNVLPKFSKGLKNDICR